MSAPPRTNDEEHRTQARPASTRMRHPIVRLLAQRVALGIVTLFVVSVVIFAATEALPGNAAVAILGHSAAPAQLHALERQLHLNRSAFDQYGSWIGGILSGHRGAASPTGCRCGASSAPPSPTRRCWWHWPG